jgi:hypothetical protein
MANGAMALCRQHKCRREKMSLDILSQFTINVACQLMSPVHNSSIKDVYVVG